MPKHTWTVNVKDEVGSSLLAATNVVEDDSETKFGVLAPTGTTTEVDLPVDVSQIVSGFLYSDQALTIKTNSSSVPDQTFTLAAKSAIGWKTGDVASNPWTTDITALYLVNSSGTDANVKGSFLLNLSS